MGSSHSKPSTLLGNTHSDRRPQNGHNDSRTSKTIPSFLEPNRHRRLGPVYEMEVVSATRNYEREFAGHLNGRLAEAIYRDELLLSYTLDHLPLPFHTFLRYKKRRSSSPVMRNSRASSSARNSRQSSYLTFVAPSYEIQPILPFNDAGFAMLAFLDHISFPHSFIPANAGEFTQCDLDYLSELICRWAGRNDSGLQNNMESGGNEDEGMEDHERHVPRDRRKRRYHKARREEIRENESGLQYREV